MKADLEIEMNKFNQMCRKIGTVNNNSRKDAEITFYKAMAVPVFTYGSKIWNTKRNR
jgi:hypothetical protein